MTSPQDRRPQVAVCTPWYPTAYNRLGGSFVADWTGLSARLAREVRVLHAEEWPGGTEVNVARWATDTQTVFSTMAQRQLLTVQGAHGPVTRVPTVLTSGMDVPARAEAAVEATRSFGSGLQGSEVVHGHVGYLGGLTAARLADPASRVIVTEHSTGLGDVLASAHGLELYTEVLERANRLTCVSGVVRDQIVEVLPQFADKVVVVPNPVNFESVPRREARPERLDRWVFAGGLIDRKGVSRLVAAFIEFASARSGATLDLFGSGPLAQALRESAESGGVADRVTFHGNVPHGDLLTALPSYDLLVAPSVFETFHLVVPEAVAAGVPVLVTRSGGPEEALAGVEDLVGAFIDVNDDAGELHAAAVDLEGRLPELDLTQGRETLNARYGRNAVTQHLAELYAVDAPDPSQASDTDAAAPVKAAGVGAPERVTLLSASGWRRYAIESEVALTDDAGVPTKVVTDDEGVRTATPGCEHTPGADFLATLRPSATGRGPLAGLRSRLRRTPAVAPGQTGTFVLTHVSGSSWAAQLLASDPDARVVIELDRVDFGVGPVDAP